MSKTLRNMMVFALCVGVVCLLLNISYLAIGFFMATAFFGLVWLVVRWLMQPPANKSKKQKQQKQNATREAPMEQQQTVLMPPQMSKGSNRLFIPKPLDRP